MRYAIGYQLLNGEFTKIIEDYREDIAEVYFPWIDNSTGRSSLINDRGYIDWAGQEQLISDLRKIKGMNIKLDLLFNGNCYGRNTISEYLANNVCSVIDYLKEIDCAVDIITTTSPFIANVVKQRYNIEVRASVNMKIGTVKGMEYVSHLFDSFYVQREYNRDFAEIEELKAWADANGKGLYMLANSGCMSNCSGQMYHDNAVSHECEIAETKNLNFNTHICWDFLRDEKNWVSLLQNTWVRPEDIKHYEKYFDVVKLATRMHALPGLVVDAYTKQRYYGNLLDLFEPGFGPAIAPYVIDNSKFPKDWFETMSKCSKRCHKCGYCNEVLKKVLVDSEGA
jgi:collagenase-like PrtC family protease